MKRKTVGWVASVLLGAACGTGTGVGGVGAQCAKGNANTQQTISTCESGLTCCGLPDTGGACQAPDGGALCPSGGSALP
jgi:hypothetical protein